MAILLKVHDGVTIDLGVMNKTEFDTSTKIARIGAGSLWENVYTALEQYGVTAPGGRTATVGVGGFTLGGGNNFVSDCWAQPDVSWGLVPADI